MELWLLFSGIGVFFGGVIVYVLLMVFVPEWVGITGKKALEAEKSHRSEIVEDEKNDLISRLERKKR